MLFDEDGSLGSTGKGLNADRAGAGVGVQEDGIYDTVAQSGEEGFAQAVGRGAGLVAFGGDQAA